MPGQSVRGSKGFQPNKKSGPKTRQTTSEAVAKPCSFSWEHHLPDEVLAYFSELHALASAREEEGWKEWYGVHGGRKATRLQNPTDLSPAVAAALQREFGARVAGMLGKGARLVDISAVVSLPGARDDCHRDVSCGAGVVAQIAIGAQPITTRGLPGSADKPVLGKVALEALAQAGHTALLLDGSMLHGAAATATGAGHGRTWLTFVSQSRASPHVTELTRQLILKAPIWGISLNDAARMFVCETKPDTLTCEECKEELPSREALMEHLYGHAGVLYECSRCDKSFKTRTECQTTTATPSRM